MFTRLVLLLLMFLNPASWAFVIEHSDDAKQNTNTSLPSVPLESSSSVSPSTREVTFIDDLVTTKSDDQLTTRSEIATSPPGPKLMIHGWERYLQTVSNTILFGIRIIN